MYCNGFLNTTPKAQYMKINIDKPDFIKFKSFCSAKAVLREWKKTPQTERMNICAKDIFDIGILSKYAKYT